MPISLLEASAVRNLAQVRLNLSPGLNLIVGVNGSGKTSLLEAIHLLATGRSFRTTEVAKVIMTGADRLTVFGRGEREGSAWRLGVERSREGQSTLKVNGARVTSTAKLAEWLPLQVMRPESHRLVEGAPKERRRFLDWGVFHVEPLYGQRWQEYRRLLRQRNAALRLGGREISTWDRLLSTTGEELHKARSAYLEALRPFIDHYLEQFRVGLQVSVDLRPGWRQEQSLAEALERAKSRDREQQRTTVGPHRAELLIRADGIAARDRLSRGQQKVVVAALLLAQVRLLWERSEKVCTVLVDDLPAELDAERRWLILEALRESGAQVVVTGVERQGLMHSDDWPYVQWFHVEPDGLVQPLTVT